MNRVAKFADFPTTRHRHKYNRERRIGLLCVIRHFLLLDYGDRRSRGRGSRDEKQDTRSHEPDGQEAVENYKVVKRHVCVECRAMLIPSKRSQFRGNWFGRNGPLKNEMQREGGNVKHSNKKDMTLGERVLRESYIFTSSPPSPYHYF